MNMSNDGETAAQIGKENGKVTGKKLLMRMYVCVCAMCNKMYV